MDEETLRSASHSYCATSSGVGTRVARRVRATVPGRSSPTANSPLRSSGSALATRCTPESGSSSNTAPSEALTSRDDCRRMISRTPSRSSDEFNATSTCWSAETSRNRSSRASERARESISAYVTLRKRRSRSITYMAKAHDRARNTKRMNEKSSSVPR
jgi:hypothetical protein